MQVPSVGHLYVFLGKCLFKDITEECYGPLSRASLPIQKGLDPRESSLFTPLWCAQIGKDGREIQEAFCYGRNK